MKTIGQTFPYRLSEVLEMREKLSARMSDKAKSRNEDWGFNSDDTS